MRARHRIGVSVFRLVLIQGLFFCSTLTSRAQTNISANLVGPETVDIEISTPLNGVATAPVIHIFEVVKVGAISKTFERQPYTDVRQLTPQNHFIARLTIPPPSNGFVRYEVEIRNYDTAAGIETFRSEILVLQGTIIKALSRTLVVRFNGLNTTDWNKLRIWIAAATAAQPNVTLRLLNGPTSSFRVTHARPVNLQLCPVPTPPPAFHYAR